MAFVTLFVFVIWMYQVRLLIALLLGLRALLSSLQEFMTVVLTTNEGLLFLAIGNAVGAALSLILFSLTVVSFPLLLDREVDFVEAVEHKASTVLFDRKRYFALQKRGAGEKTIANCGDCAHGAPMSERAVVSAHTRRHDDTRAT